MGLHLPIIDRRHGQDAAPAAGLKRGLQSIARCGVATQRLFENATVVVVRRVFLRFRCSRPSKAAPLRFSKAAPAGACGAPNLERTDSSQRILKQSLSPKNFPPPARWAHCRDDPQRQAMRSKCRWDSCNGQSLSFYVHPRLSSLVISSSAVGRWIGAVDQFFSVTLTAEEQSVSASPETCCDKWTETIRRGDYPFDASVV